MLAEQAALASPTTKDCHVAANPRDLSQGRGGNQPLLTEQSTLSDLRE
jgi:hypothetical protein